MEDKPKDMNDKILNSFKTKIESDTSDAEKRLISLINGDEPRDDHERAMAKEIEKAKKEGKVIYIPSN